MVRARRRLSLIVLALSAAVFFAVTGWDATHGDTHLEILVALLAAGTGASAVICAIVNRVMVRYQDAFEVGWRARELQCLAQNIPAQSEPQLHLVQLPQD